MIADVYGNVKYASTCFAKAGSMPSKPGSKSSWAKTFATAGGMLGIIVGGIGGVTYHPGIMIRSMLAFGLVFGVMGAGIGFLLGLPLDVLRNWLNPMQPPTETRLTMKLPNWEQAVISPQKL